MKQFRVFVTSKDCPKSAIDILDEICEVKLCPADPVASYDDIWEHCKDVDAIFWASNRVMDIKILDRAGPGLKVVSTMSAGVDKLDLIEARRRNLKLGYTPGINGRAVAEIAIGLLLEVTRRMAESRKHIYDNTWLPYRPNWMAGKDIGGSTIGIVGMGNIGVCIAKRMQGFEISGILYCGPNRKSEGDELGAEFVPFHTLLQKSDFIFVACPLNKDTHHLFNDRTFSLMKTSAVIINIARGEIVDQQALIKALQNNIIWGAGLDVMTPEPLSGDNIIFHLNNCVVTPHIGAMTEWTQNAMANLAAQNIVSALKGEPMAAPIPL